MLTTQERSLFSLRVFERFKPTWKRTTRVAADILHNIQSERYGSATGADPSNIIGQDTTPDDVPASSGLVQMDELPPYTLILGICEDQVPFILDLTNPAPGSFLIAGDSQSGKTRLLEAILASSDYFAPSNQLEISLVTGSSAGSLASLPEDIFAKVVPSGSPAASEKIQELAELTEQRHHGYQHGAVHILVLEDLAAVTADLDQYTFGRLYWLIKHGPRSRVWVFARLNAEETGNIDERLLAAFRTRLIGRIQDRGLAGYLSGDEYSPAMNLAPGDQFCALFGEEWIRFSIYAGEG